MRANGLAHLPPIIARQLTLKTTFSAKWPPHTRAEGGQVVGSGDDAWDVGEADPLLSISFESASVPSPYPGFHPLPPRTGREVFPHPALRQPSSWSIQDIHRPGLSQPATSGQAATFLSLGSQV